MKIVTLTLNPAFDIHCHIDDFKAYHENLANITDREAGGKGVNISRALCVNEILNLALVVLGDENAESFKKSLDSDGMNYRAITVEGRIRENITIHTDNAPETRISFSGFDADISLLKKTEAVLSEVVEKGSCVTFTGRVPSGLTMTDVKAFLRSMQNKGVNLVIDSRSFSLDDLIEIKPWLIKPNQEEISEYLGRKIDSFEQAVSSAQELFYNGIENVMISLGEKGALLVCGEGTFTAIPPQIEIRSTIGAGDSSIAGFLSAAVNGLPASECIRTAVAYGTAACMTSGTKPPRSDDIEEILKLVTVK